MFLPLKLNSDIFRTNMNVKNYLLAVIPQWWVILKMQKKISLWLVWPILRFFPFIAAPIWDIIKISLLLKMYFIKWPIFCAPLFYFKMIHSGIHPVHRSYICKHTGLSSFGCILRRGVRSPFQKWESGSSRLTSQPELGRSKKSLDSSSPNSFDHMGWWFQYRAADSERHKCKKGRG